jgi:Flp pilus assembly pilin Flp
MTTRGDDVESGRQRSPRGPSSRVGALRRWLADEAGAVSLEYLMVTMTCGLLAAIGLIAAIGPSLVSMWSERRACLYDDTCLSQPSPRQQSRTRAQP